MSRGTWSRAFWPKRPHTIRFIEQEYNDAMRFRIRRSRMFRNQQRMRDIKSTVFISILAAISFAVVPAGAQSAAYKAPRTADGKPDLNGIWQVLNTANWDIQGHAAAPGPM